MSALGGIYNFADRPIDPATLTAMGNTLAHLGPDGGQGAWHGSIGMVFRGFNASRETHLDIQPLDKLNRYLLTFDGRLDNRHEIVRQLHNFTSQSTSDLTDSKIVALAYEKWGLDCFKRLIGDFALVVWDSVRKHLLLARDPFGIRTLYYHLNKTRIVWSSYLGAIINLKDVAPTISDEYVSGFLTRFPDPWETPYKNVWAVKPGHYLIVKEGLGKERQYWSLPQNREINYKNDEEYEQHFNALFEESIRCHTRTTYPVIVQLSGGLDSSSVVCVLNRLIKDGRSSVSDLRTLSFVYEEARTSDERRFIRLVEDWIGRIGYHLREEDASCLSLTDDDHFISAPTFGHCFAKRNERLRKIIKDSGARILLTGQAGDQLVYSSDDPSPELADLIAKWRFLEFHKRTKTWSLVSKQPYLHHLWRTGLLLFPYSVTSFFGYRKQVPLWINQSFAKRMSLRERLSTDRDVYKCKLPSQRDQSRALSSTIAGLAASHYSEWLEIEVGHPFLYRPLVEFLHSIPPDQRLRPGETRSLMRRALRGVLPEKVAQRKGKQGPDEALYRALIREWPKLYQLFSNSFVCQRGYADHKTLMAALDRARHGAERYTFKLLLTISLELWLRSFEKLSLDERADNRSPSINMLAWRNATFDFNRTPVAPAKL